METAKPGAKAKIETDLVTQFDQVSNVVEGMKKAYCLADHQASAA